MTKRRLLKFGLPILGVLAIVGVAFAFWSAAGTGSGSGSSASNPQDVSLSGGTVSADLIPGGTGDVSVSIDNPNTFSVHVNSLVLDTSQGTGGYGINTGHSGCDLSSAITFTTPQDNSGNGWDVPAKSGGTDGSLAVDLTGAITMDTSADNACQGANFTVHLKPGS
ncbi:MAG: hypothetical protein ACJ768_22685 [Gaiellaceae bacterium]